MKAVMYGAIGDGSLVELRETLFDKELDLQQFLSTHSGLLAGDQMNPANPRRFVLVTAEAGIAIAQGGGSYFSLDHLFIDQDGIPTLVEVKRSTDTRLRREVIGQMLEYASNACAFWGVERLRLAFEHRCEKAGLDTGEELQKLSTGPEDGSEGIWEKVAQNLRQERLRLVFLADKFQPETQRVIEFMNRQMQLSEVYAVEVRQYVGLGLKTLVPRVLNSSVLQADRRAAATGSVEPWTRDRFYSDLLTRRGEQAVTVLRKVDEWGQAQPRVATLFGEGKFDGSIQITHKHGDDPSIYQPGDTVFVTLWTYGRVEIEFKFLMQRKIFAPDALREELWRRLTSKSSLKIDKQRIAKRPSVQWSELVDAANMETLLSAMEWIVSELNAAETADSSALLTYQE